MARGTGDDMLRMHSGGVACVDVHAGVSVMVGGFGLALDGAKLVVILPALAGVEKPSVSKVGVSACGGPWLEKGWGRRLLAGLRVPRARPESKGRFVDSVQASGPGEEPQPRWVRLSPGPVWVDLR